MRIDMENLKKNWLTVICPLGTYDVILRKSPLNPPSNLSYVKIIMLYIFLDIKPHQWMVVGTPVYMTAC